MGKVHWAWTVRMNKPVCIFHAIDNTFPNDDMREHDCTNGSTKAFGERATQTPIDHPGPRPDSFSLTPGQAPNVTTHDR